MSRNRDAERIVVCNAYGEVVDTAKVTRYDEHAVRVSAPGYLGRTVVVDFNDEPDVVLLTMDPNTAQGPELLDACEMNLDAAAYAVWLGGTALGEWLLVMPVLRAQDRCYYKVGTGLGKEMVDYMKRTGAWRSVPSGLHERHEEGFEIVGSWKTTRGAPDLQVTMWRREQMLMVNTEGYAKLRKASWEYVAELDLDLRTGAGHIFEVLGNHLIGDKTHPYAVMQAIVWVWGIEPPFKLEPGE